MSSLPFSDLFDHPDPNLRAPDYEGEPEKDWRIERAECIARLSKKAAYYGMLLKRIMAMDEEQYREWAEADDFEGCWS